MEKTGTERKNKGGDGVCEAPRNRAGRPRRCGLGGGGARPGRPPLPGAVARARVLPPFPRRGQGGQGCPACPRSGEAAPPTVFPGAARFSLFSGVLVWVLFFF